VAEQGDRRMVVAHIWGIVESTSSFLGIENCWLNLGRKPDLMMAWFDRWRIGWATWPRAALTPGWI
jgi:hypothetical protein